MRADRRRGHDVGDQVRPEQLDRRRAAPAAFAPSRVPLDDRSRRRRRCRRSSAPRQREQQPPRAAAPRQRQRRRIVGVDHRPVVGGLVREDPRLRRARTPRRVAMAIEVVGREVQQHRDPRMERVDRLRAGSCSPRRRGACRASTRRPARSAARRCCRRPSTSMPAASSIRPVSVVVVDLPFVPVIAMTRPRSQRDASSSSPITGTPRARAASIAGCSRRHAGTQHDQIGAGERRRRVAAELERDAGVAQPLPRRRSASRVRSASPSRRGARAARAAAMPLRAAPTTTTRLPAHGERAVVVIAASTSSG